MLRTYSTTYVLYYLHTHIIYIQYPEILVEKHVYESRKRGSRLYQRISILYILNCMLLKCKYMS